MLLVFFLDVVEYFERFGNRGRLDHYLLEASFEGSVLFDVFAVFVQCCGPDALYIAASQSRFEHIGCIHGALCVAGADNGVYLINK